MKKHLLFIPFIICLLTVKAQPGRYYVNDQAIQPWGSITNISAMNQAFGVGGWTQAYFQSVNVNALFQPSVCLIYMDGSATNATALGNFLTLNSAALQNWVLNGGKLFLNASPTQGSNIDFGFSGNTCVYPAGISNTGTASVGQTGHPVFNFPFLPAGTAYGGNPFATAYLTTSNATAIITGTAGTVLNELIFGSGRAMFGSMSTTNWQNPIPNAANLRANILVYLAGFGTTSSAANPTVLCTGQSATLTASGLQPGATYSWLPTNQSGTTIVITPTATTSYTVIGTPTLGCYSQAALSITVNPLPTVTAVSSNSPLCTGETATLTASGAISYTWNPGAGGASISVSPTINTSYTLTGINANGCTNSFILIQNVDPCTGIILVSNSAREFRMFPNPNSGSFKIQIDKEINNGELILINSLGQKVHKQKISQGENEIITKELSTGLHHYIILQNMQQVINGKIIIESDR